MSDCPTPRTYFVVSEETLIRPACFGDAPEPAEYGRYVDEVRARSKREAIRVAYDDPDSDLRKWAKKNRADGRHPFAGLTVEHPHCEHGVCLDIAEDGDPTTVCKPCDDAFRAALEEEDT